MNTTILTKAKVVLLSALFILFPLFFLPITQEFFAINKFVLTSLVALGLLVVLLIQLLVERKITISYSKLDTPVLFLIIAASASILISSPNKVSAFFNFPLGLASLLSFYVVYLITKNLADENWKNFKPLQILSIGGVIAGFVSLVFIANPFASYPLPNMFAFLKTPLFNTVGSTLDLLLFSGFFLSIALGVLLMKNKRNIPVLAAGAVAALVIVLMTFSIIKTNQVRLPPVSQSWLAAVETLKRPKTALFGVGIDNFAGQFTLVKNTAYNTNQLWNTNFALSRSALLHVWTEMGILGLLSVITIIASIALLLTKLFSKKDSQALVFALAGVYLVAVLTLFPPSFAIFFLLFVYLGLLASRTPVTVFTLDVRKNLLVYLALILGFALMLPTCAYGLFRSYMAEVHFKQSLDALSTGQVVPIYQNVRDAIILNPYQEKYRLTFSQLNLLIANNIALQKKDTLTDQDRQNITQAIQDAIREAKAAVALNPDKASNWENLAIIYQNLLNVAQGADAWAISAYQKAILLDPVNPQLRLSLGGVYYSLKQFPTAATFFSQAVSLKPDWANARYNIAWAFYQNKEYDKAIGMMQSVLTLVDKHSADYQKASAELKTFQDAKLDSTQQEVGSKDVQEATAEAVLQSPEATDEAKLDLPQEPKAVVSPKIELPQEASPEAR